MELSLSGMSTASHHVALCFAEWLPRAAKLAWSGCHNNDNHICGGSFENFKNLAELYMDNCEFEVSGNDGLASVCGDPESSACLLTLCNRGSLRRVSIKSATWHHYADPHNGRGQVFRQEVLVNFVRKLSSLRWLRSDLTAATVAMLKEEQPEITFVSK